MTKKLDYDARDTEDMYSVPMTPERLYTIKIMGFSYVKDEKKDPKVWLEPDELAEYYEWLKTDKD